MLAWKTEPKQNLHYLFFNLSKQNEVFLLPVSYQRFYLQAKRLQKNMVIEEAFSKKKNVCF